MKFSIATRPVFQWILTIAGLLLLSVLLVVGFWRPGLLRGENNDGHQLGGDLISSLPGNTIEVFQLSLEKFESNEDYLYSECDLRETKDGQIVVFHDWDIGDLVPDTDENRAALGVDRVGSIPIKDLTFGELKSLRLVGGCEIPSLEEVLQFATDSSMQKPLLLEIKLLLTDEGRNRVLELAKEYRDKSEVEIHFLAFRRNISRSFPNERKWLDKFADSEFRVYQVFRSKTDQYDLCKSW